MGKLTDPREALRLLRLHLRNCTDTLTREAENASRTEETRVSGHTDAALTPTDTTTSEGARVSVASVLALTQENPVQDVKNSRRVSASVRFGGGDVQPTRDPDPSGCPPHWQVVPMLPPKGSRIKITDERGLGRLYRVKVGGMWWLITFLPPYDGRVSLTDEHHRVRVFRSLVEAGTYLATLCGTEVAPRHREEVRG